MGMALSQPSRMYPTMFVTCYVHTTNKMPRELAHEHHIVPRAAKGGDSKDNLVYLCPNCHDAVHQLAGMMVHNRAGEMVDIVYSAYPHPPQRKKILELASVVSESMVRKKAGEIETDHIVPLVLDHELFLMVKRMANDFKRGGRAVGISRFVHALIVRELRQRGYRVKNESY